MVNNVILLVVWLVGLIGGIGLLWWRYRKLSSLLYLVNFFSLTIILFFLYLSLQGAVNLIALRSHQLADNMFLYAGGFALLFVLLKRFCGWFSYRSYAYIHQSTTLATLIAFILLLTCRNPVGFFFVALFGGYALMSLWFGLLIFNYKTSNLFNPLKSVAYYGFICLLAYCGAWLAHRLWTLPNPPATWNTLVIVVGTLFFALNIIIWVVSYWKPFEDKSYLLFNLTNLPTDSFLPWSKKSLALIIAFLLVSWWATNNEVLRQLNNNPEQTAFFWAQLVPLMIALGLSFILSTIIIRYVKAHWLVIICGLTMSLSWILLLADHSNSQLFLVVFSLLRFVFYLNLALLVTFMLMWHYRQPQQILFFEVVVGLCACWAFNYYVPWMFAEQSATIWLVVWATISLISWQVFLGWFCFWNKFLVGEYANIMELLIPKLRIIIEQYTAESNKLLEAVIV